MRFDCANIKGGNSLIIQYTNKYANTSPSITKAQNPPPVVNITLDVYGTIYIL